MLPVTLASGASMSIPAKQWVTIPAAEENSASVASVVQKRFLVRSSIPDDVPAAPVVEPEKIEVEKAVAEMKPLVQNQTPKLESPMKAVFKPEKVDAPAATKLTDEPKRKRE